MPSQYYRLRVWNSDNSLALEVTSVAGGTAPYIAAPPSGDGQEVDLLTGAVRTGAYVVEVVDVATGTDATGTIRVVTNTIYDGTTATARPKLLSRRAVIDVDDAGTFAAPTVWQAGYVSNIRQIDAMRYAITVSNTRRVEQTQRIFSWDTAAERTRFPKRGCLFGGPVIGGFGAQDGQNLAPDSGGWEFTVNATLNNFWSGSSSGGLTALVSLDFNAAYLQPNYEKKTTLTREDFDKFYASMAPYVVYDSPLFLAYGSSWEGLNDRSPIYSYPTVRALLTDSSGNSWTGTIRGLFTPGAAPLNIAIQTGSTAGTNRLFVQLDGSSVDGSGNITPALSNGTTVRVRGVSIPTTPLSPLYFDEHPVDVAKKLYEVIGIEVDATSVTAAKEAIGEQTRLACRITEPQVMAEFLEKAIFGPFGFAARIIDKVVSGQLQPVAEFFLTRELGTSAPTLTISTNDLVGDTPPPIFDLDEATVVTGYTVTQKQIAKWVQPENTTDIPPADMLVENEVTIEVLTGDTTTFSTRIVPYDLQGMVHEVGSFTSDPKSFALTVANEGFERFGRGAPSIEVEVLRSAASAAAKLGELVYLSAGFYPNRNYRIGEAPSIGARVAQVVRREERPESVLFKLVDAGSYNQPTDTPTISVIGNSNDPRRTATFKIDNAATLNTKPVVVTVQYATGASAPSGTKNGTTIARYEAGKIPTGYVPLPPVVPGTTVWVRARSEQPGLFPSAWTAWGATNTYVTLTSWVVPTVGGTPVTSITNASAIVTWGLASNTADPIEVYVYPGTVAPANWQQYRWAVLPPGTTTTALLGLSASTNYVVGVAFFDAITQVRGTVTTATFTTTASTSGTAPTPVGLQVVPGTNDGTLPQGIVLALYSAAGALQTVVERSTTSGSGFTTLAVVPAETQVYVDYLPKDGTTYYYRLKHRQPGQADSTATPEASGSATGVTGVIVPSFSAPSLKAVTTPGTSSYDIVVTWDGTIVYNLDGVSQSVSGWTSPRTVNVTRDTGTATKVAAFAVTKTGVTVSESVNVPPVASSVPAITSAYFSNGFTPGDGGGSVDITWTVANMPSGVTYDIDLVDVTGSPITDASAAYTGVTSPYTASIALGTGATATCVIQALVGGIPIATYSFRSAIPI